MAKTTIRLVDNENRLWNIQQVRMFVEQLKARVGEAGWQYLSHEMRDALVSQHALRVVMGLERGEVPCASIGCLYRDMLLVAGLIEQ